MKRIKFKRLYRGPIKWFRSLPVQFIIYFFLSVLIAGIITITLVNQFIISKIPGNQYEYPIEIHNLMKGSLYWTYSASDIQQVANRYSGNFNAEIWVVDKNDKLIAKSDNAGAIPSEVRGKYFYGNIKDKQFYKDRVDIKGKQAYIIISKKVAIDVNAWNLSAYILIASTITLSIVIYLFFIRKKIKQLTLIFEGINQVNKGNKTYQIKKVSRDQLGELADSINEMIRNVNESNEKSLKVEQQKNELVVNMSHDVRTPLTTLLGYLHLLTTDLDDSTKQKYAKLALDQGMHLKELTDDLFQLTKLNQMNECLDKKQIDVNLMLYQLADEFTPIVSQEFAIELKLLDEPIMINGDTKLLLRLFQNIFINAMKHSIKPTSFIIKEKLEGNQVVLSFQNKAKPLSEEQLSQLFERFYQGDPSRTKGDQSGLGLAIVKRIVELHDGDVNVKMEGEIFSLYVKLPIQL